MDNPKYTIEDLKTKKLVINYRRVENLEKLHKIMKALIPWIKDESLPNGASTYYYWANGHINCRYRGFKPEGYKSCTVDDIDI